MSLWKPWPRPAASTCSLLDLTRLGCSSRRFPVAPDGHIPNSVIRAVYEPVDSSEGTDEKQEDPAMAALRRRLMARGNIRPIAESNIQDDDSFDELLISRWSSWADDDEGKDKCKGEAGSGFKNEEEQQGEDNSIEYGAGGHHSVTEASVFAASSCTPAVGLVETVSEKKEQQPTVRAREYDAKVLGKALAAGRDDGALEAEAREGQTAPIRVTLAEAAELIGQADEASSELKAVGTSSFAATALPDSLTASETVKAASSTTGELVDEPGWHGGVVGVEVRYGAGVDEDFVDSQPQEQQQLAAETDSVGNLDETGVVCSGASFGNQWTTKIDQLTTEATQTGGGAKPTSESAEFSIQSGSPRRVTSRRSQQPARAAGGSSVPVASMYDLMGDHRLKKLLLSLPRIRPVDLEAIAARLRAVRDSRPSRISRTSVASLSPPESLYRQSTKALATSNYSIGTGDTQFCRHRLVASTVATSATLPALKATTLLADGRDQVGRCRRSAGWPGHCPMERLARRGLDRTVGLSPGPYLAREELLWRLQQQQPLSAARGRWSLMAA